MFGNRPTKLISFGILAYFRIGSNINTVSMDIGDIDGIWGF